MPELPEVETVVREVRPHLIGRRIASVQVSPHALRRAWSPAWKKALVGQRFVSVERRGKWIFVSLESSSNQPGAPATGTFQRPSLARRAGSDTPPTARLLVIHLGMTGQLTVVSAATLKADHTHVVFGLQGTGHELRFRDVRRFGSVTLLEPHATIDNYLAQIGLGPEPFTVSPDYWHEHLAKTRRCLKAILLDQRVVAGVGNIYADESLFAARLHPTRLGNSLTRLEIRRLGEAVPAVLTRAIDKRGSTIRDYVGGSGLRGGFQHEFCVYGRTGEPCGRCKSAIAQIRLAGRSTHFCPRCQKA